MKFLVILVTLVVTVAGQMAMPFGPYAVNPPAMTHAAVPLPYSGFPVSYAAPGPISYQTGVRVVAKKDRFNDRTLIVTQIIIGGGKWEYPIQTAEIDQYAVDFSYKTRRLKCETIKHSSTLVAVKSHLKSPLKMKFLAVLVALVAVFACVMAQGYNNNGNYASASYSAPSAPAPAPSPYGAPAPSPYGAPAPSPYGAPAPSPYGAPAPSPYGASARGGY
ncbi:Uncharacterized protein APZ42_019088 [Daphnia magna]|uniref:Uncharacterized protein n=1 Tax=Daphnia magna TaxID=35525 RepID=A0A164YMV1_9CRUS|nr:Uncharacterized protein APZ42_019088 [Daphnia magna]